MKHDRLTNMYGPIESRKAACAIHALRVTNKTSEVGYLAEAHVAKELLVPLLQ